MWICIFCIYNVFSCVCQSVGLFKGRCGESLTGLRSLLYSPPPYVQNEARTVCRRAVIILLECFLVVACVCFCLYLCACVFSEQGMRARTDHEAEVADLVALDDRAERLEQLLEIVLLDGVVQVADEQLVLRIRFQRRLGSGLTVRIVPTDKGFKMFLAYHESEDTRGPTYGVLTLPNTDTYTETE